MSDQFEARLRQAVCEAGDLLDASLPPADQCDHLFSPAFEQKMEKFLRRRKRLSVYRGLQRAACLFLACLLSGAVLLSTNAQAREALFGWVREQVESAQRYFFQGEGIPTSSIVHYQIDVPEGYWLSDQMQGESYFYFFYVGEDGLYLDFLYQYNTVNSTAETYVTDTDATMIETEVQGNPADLYISNDPNASNTIIWMDKKTGALIEVTAFLPQEELMALAESVSPVENNCF